MWWGMWEGVGHGCYVQRWWHQLPLPAGHEVRLEAVEGSGGRDLAAVLEAAE